MAKSRHTGKIQLDITYMNITTPFHAQKTLRNLHFEFPRGSLLFSWHCAPLACPALSFQFQSFAFALVENSRKFHLDLFGFTETL